MTRFDYYVFIALLVLGQLSMTSCGGGEDDGVSSSTDNGNGSSYNGSYAGKDFAVLSVEL